MDEYTLRHLDRWLELEIFPEHRPRVRAEMVRIYESDPEHWQDRGWWAVYDQGVPEKLDAEDAEREERKP